MTASSKSVTSGAEIFTGSDVTCHAPTPDVTPIAAPDERTACVSVERPAADPTPSGSAANLHQQARDAAAELAYPDDRYGWRTARTWPTPLVYIQGGKAPIDMSWNDGTGLCAGNNPDLWFPAKNGAKAARDAKDICLSGCPLLEPCREHGIRHEQVGVWGGLSAEERVKARRFRLLNRGGVA